MAKGTGRRPPPEHTRYKPGQSGNPKGRPKHAKNLATIFNEVMGAPVTLSEKGRPVQRTRLEVILLQLSTDSIKGNPKARELLLRMARDLEAASGKRPPEADRDPATSDDGLAPDPQTLRLILKRFQHLGDQEDKA
jgi:hypothetical protein